MTDAQSRTLMVKDGAGDYFLVPWETLVQGRVPAEQKAELERLIAAVAQGGEGGDVQGFIEPLTAFFIGTMIASAFMTGVSLGAQPTGTLGPRLRG